MSEKKKLTINHADGSKTEVTPSKAWSPCRNECDTLLDLDGLRAEIRSLRTKNADLEARVAELEGELENISQIECFLTHGGHVCCIAEERITETAAEALLPATPTESAKKSSRTPPQIWSDVYTALMKRIEDHGGS